MAGVASRLSGLLLRGRPTHDDAGPGAEVDPVVLGQLSTLARRQGVLGQWAARGSDVGAVGALQILDPPALAVSGQLCLASAHADVGRAFDVRMDVAAHRAASDEQALCAQRHDGRQTWRRARLVTFLAGIPVSYTHL